MYFQNVQVGVDGTSGRLKYLTKDGVLSLKVDQNFFWYNSSDGKNTNKSQPSGAYIFRWVEQGVAGVWSTQGGCGGYVGQGGWDLGQDGCGGWGRVHGGVGGTNHTLINTSS